MKRLAFEFADDGDVEIVRSKSSLSMTLQTSYSQTSQKNLSGIKKPSNDAQTEEPTEEQRQDESLVAAEKDVSSVEEAASSIREDEKGISGNAVEGKSVEGSGTEGANRLDKVETSRADLEEAVDEGHQGEKPIEEEEQKEKTMSGEAEDFVVAPNFMDSAPNGGKSATSEIAEIAVQRECSVDAEELTADFLTFVESEDEWLSYEEKCVRTNLIVPFCTRQTTTSN